MPEYIWGRNPVMETLHSPRQVKRILFAEGQREASTLAAILQEAKRRHIPTEKVARARLDQLSHGAVHQGCIAVVEKRAYATLDEILAHAEDKHEAPFLLILDAIQDVNNLGSLLRTAEAAGVHGVILPERRAAEVNATVIKTSAGATEHLLIAQETNLTRTIEFLLEYFPEMPPMWISNLLSNQKVIKYNAGDIILRGNEGIVLKLQN